MDPSPLHNDSPVPKVESIPPPPIIAPASRPIVPLNSPFNFAASIRRMGGKISSIYRELDELDQMIPSGPLIVHSERSGGGTRYIMRILHILHTVHIMHTTLSCPLFCCAGDRFWKKEPLRLLVQFAKLLLSQHQKLFQLKVVTDSFKRLEMTVSIRKTFNSIRCRQCPMLSYKLCCQAIMAKSIQ